MLLAGCGSNGSEQPPTLSDDSLYATFRDPGNEWRGKPFWSWNGRLEKDELTRQLHVFKEMGQSALVLVFQDRSDILGDKEIRTVFRLCIVSDVISQPVI